MKRHSRRWWNADHRRRDQSRGYAGHLQAPAIRCAETAERVVIETDIGDDIDDAFAVALALCSPELQILGISTTFGDTAWRARLLDRLLGEVGREDIPIAVDSPIPTVSHSRSIGLRSGHSRDSSPGSE